MSILKYVVVFTLVYPLSIHPLEFPVCLFNVKVSVANGDLSNADLLTSSRLAPSQALSKNKQGEKEEDNFAYKAGDFSAAYSNLPNNSIIHFCNFFQGKEGYGY